MHRRLACGVAAPDNKDVSPSTQRGLTDPGAIVNSFTVEAALVRQIESSIFDSCCANTDACGNLRAGSQCAQGSAGAKFGLNTFSDQQDVGPKSGRLIARAPRKI